MFRNIQAMIIENCTARLDAKDPLKPKCPLAEPCARHKCDRWHCYCPSVYALLEPLGFAGFMLARHERSRLTALKREALKQTNKIEKVASQLDRLNPNMAHRLYVQREAKITREVNAAVSSASEAIRKHREYNLALMRKGGLRRVATH